MHTCSRPPLTEIPLATVWPARKRLAYMTLSIGQWDGLLQAAYDAGYVLIEMDEAERPVAAYRTPAVN